MTLILVAVVILGGYRFIMGPDAARVLTRPHIAELTISGMIVDDPALLQKIEDIGDDTRVKALIVSLSTGGGSTYGGERIYKALRAVAEKKPVVADIRTEAASAGYMIALAGDRIFAGETSITGSIGVLFMYPQAKELLDKIGVTMGTVKSAPMKAEPLPFDAATPQVRAMLGSVVSDSYNWFVDLVAERRDMPREKALALADGRIVTGRQAVEDGLIDAVGGQKDILAYLHERDVPENLDIESWDDINNDGFDLNMANAAVFLLQKAGLGSLVGEYPGKGAGFVDGLVSVWQNNW
ncbi:signal peptide peptidase SppA [Martelella alba]|uniref:Signal peptide peptidase SppA n=1 Tax=Martelella alba TaxID=2590451 RepID=A0A506U139_9HYPH|nr:signal peptide peptidase SppA [Martelella alba]TPW28072.1 signal peptide peptidase SppA [Martelella alba]